MKRLNKVGLCIAATGLALVAFQNLMPANVGRPFTANFDGDSECPEFRYKVGVGNHINPGSGDFTKRQMVYVLRSLNCGLTWERTNEEVRPIALDGSPAYSANGVGNFDSNFYSKVPGFAPRLNFENLSSAIYPVFFDFNLSRWFYADSPAPILGNTDGPRRDNFYSPSVLLTGESDSSVKLYFGGWRRDYAGQSPVCDMNDPSRFDLSTCRCALYDAGNAIDSCTGDKIFVATNAKSVTNTDNFLAFAVYKGGENWERNGWNSPGFEPIVSPAMVNTQCYNVHKGDSFSDNPCPIRLDTTNDPTVIKVADNYYLMYFTGASWESGNFTHVAMSYDGLNWGNWHILRSKNNIPFSDGLPFNSANGSVRAFYAPNRQKIYLASQYDNSGHIPGFTKVINSYSYSGTTTFMTLDLSDPFRVEEIRKFNRTMADPIGFSDSVVRCVPGTLCDVTEFMAGKDSAHRVLGFIDGIVVDAQDHAFLNGWACDRNDSASIQVHAYFGGPAGTGQFGTAGEANQSSHQGVNEACGDAGGGRHDFSIPLSDELRRSFAGSQVFVHGISKHGGANSVLTNSPVVPALRLDEGSLNQIKNLAVQMLGREPDSLSLDNVRQWWGSILLNGTMEDVARVFRESDEGRQHDRILKHETIGTVDGIVVDSQDRAFVQGWACDRADSSSVQVHFYFGGPAGVGQFGTAGEANQSSHQGVNEACGDAGGGRHDFSIPLSDELRRSFAGSQVFVHGISKHGGANSVLTNSPVVPALRLDTGILSQIKNLAVQILGRSPDALTLDDVRQWWGGLYNGSIDYVGRIFTDSPEGQQHAQILEHETIGDVDGIVVDSQDRAFVNGWACDRNDSASIQVHAYFGGPAGTGQFGTAGEANQSSHQGVNEACGDAGGGRHDFSIPLSDELRRSFAGSQVFVHGISKHGGANSVLTNSPVVPALRLDEGSLNQIKNLAVQMLGREPDSLSLDNVRQWWGSILLNGTMEDVARVFRESDEGLHFARSPFINAGFIDGAWYLRQNPDLIAAFGPWNTAAAINHWFTSGLAEGRPGSAFFSPADYLSRYPDLKAAFGQDYAAAARHFLDNGLSEGRVGSPLLESPIFIFEDFTRFNPDVAAAHSGDRKGMTIHWMTRGMSEGRQSSRYFSAPQYVQMYVDLSAAFGSDYLAATQHYLNGGRYEGRAGVLLGSPMVFNADFYLHNNLDLMLAFGNRRDLATYHWIDHGIYEGRQGNDQFLSAAYVRQNVDIWWAAGDYSLAILHYLNYGFAEGRRGI